MTPDPDGETSAPPALSVVILAYNEEANIKAALVEMLAVLQGLDAPWELLLVNDGSTDDTRTLFDSAAEGRNNVRAIHHVANQGLGGAYRTGFSEALGRAVTFFPADAQFPATIVAEFLPLMSDQDMVLGYVPKRTDALLARILSVAERALYALLFGRIPRFQGIMMFQRRLLGEVRLRSQGRGWGIALEFILRVSRGGYRVRSVPIEIRPRMSGESKVINLRNMYSNLLQVLNLRRTLNRSDEDDASVRRPAAEPDSDS